MAIPGLAERVGGTPRVLRYWEEQGLISPSREHGRLRYGPRDEAIARLIRLLMDRAGYGVESIRMMRALAQREIRQAARLDDRDALAEVALRLLYARKAFREETGVDEERFLVPVPDQPRPPGRPQGPGRPPERGHGPSDRGSGPAGDGP